MEKIASEITEDIPSETPEQGAPVDRPASVEKKTMTDEEIDSDAERAFKGRQEQRIIREKEMELGIDSYGTKKSIDGNYKGDWTLALYKRLKHPDMKEKLLALRWPVFNGALPYKVEQFIDKDIFTKKFYYDKIRNFNRDVDTALSYTTYVSASSEGYNPETLGNPSENGTVFCDATLNGRPLSKPQKNAIEAHEKGHVVRGFKIDTQDISKGFDFSKISPDSPNPNYLRNPDELIERMSQLKNYFGFEGDEVFTRPHLTYAREHYLQDGALDNSMKDFFAMITSDKENEFLRIANEYPI